MVSHPRWLAVAVLIGLLAAVAPAHAQFFGQRSGGGFFGGLFGAPQYPFERQRPPREPRHEAPADYSHAPPPRRSEAKDAPQPATTILVMGDGMADWLGYGLEDAFSDTPDVAIVRKDKSYSGLLRYDAKNDLDWWHVARDILAQQKLSYVVMMLGVADRQGIRERDLAKEAEREAKEQEEKKAAEENKAAEINPDGSKAADPSGKDEPDKSEPDKKNAEQAKPKKPPTGSLEFRSEAWEKIYIKRIDETIAALKSKGVPVFWVGLPPIRGTKATADTGYLDGLYRTRAQRAGIVYIDVWDGFVDEDGKYSSYGPDYEGQRRRLRSGDGVYFTKYGARKLAHYVEREIRRYMSNRVVALPSQTAVPASLGKPTERPVAGPVVPLAALPANSDELIGPGARAHGDALAARVLTKGEPIASQPGRADDFAWPPGSTPPKPAAAPKPPEAAKPEAAVRPQPAAMPAVPVGPPPVASPVPARTETEASAKPVEPSPQPAEPPVAVVAPATEPAPAVDAEPASIVAPEPESPAAGPKPKPQPAKRAEAKPRPHPQPAQSARPRRPAPPPHRGDSNPLSELFGVFR